MNTSSPTPGRIFVIAAFSLSCFGLLLFFWLAFGGPIPLKPQGYRVQVAFTDAATLAEQADVRTAGVSIGKVVSKELAPGRQRLRRQDAGDDRAARAATRRCARTRGRSCARRRCSARRTSS